MKIKGCFLTAAITLILLQACAPNSINVRTIDGQYLPRTFKPIIGVAALQQELNRILADPAIAPVNSGVIISNLRDGSILYEHNAYKLFHPASTMKLYTSAAALNYLGPDYTFLTRLAIDSTAVIADTLRGNIYIIGGGDPVFSLSNLAALTRQLVDLGIRYINGDIVCDAEFLDDLPVGEGWMWDDAGAWYSAPLSALSIQENCVDIIVNAAKKNGDPVQVSLYPKTQYVIINNTSTTLDSATYFALRFDSTKVFEHFRVERRWREKENIVDVSGFFGDWYAEGRTTVDIVDAPRYFGMLFRETCENIGIGIQGETVFGVTPVARKIIATHRSQPLAQLLAAMNKPSSNLCAELFLKTVGAVSSGEQGTAKKGLYYLKNLLNNWGIDTTQINLADGSGVSRYTLVNAASTHQLLQQLYKQFQWRHEFIASLPVAGVDGTLKSRMRHSAAEGVVHAKTGTLSGVSALAGYTTSADGDELVFSITMSHFVGKAKVYRDAQDRICDAISRFQKEKK